MIGLRQLPRSLSHRRSGSWTWAASCVVTRSQSPLTRISAETGQGQKNEGGQDKDSGQEQQDGQDQKKQGGQDQQQGQNQSGQSEEESNADVRATMAASSKAKELGIDLSKVRGTGAENMVTTQDLEQVLPE
jgi:pyruvate/2-oxoglutarate dehydrogenase complex dihydrolipoamide acyltransferase (E2) component